MRGFGKWVVLPGTQNVPHPPRLVNRATYSTSSASSKATPPQSYASTLLLPKTKFRLWPNYASRQVKVGKRTNESLYAWQWTNNRGPVFILHDGPPYANGALHMGHALNKILKDVINRFQVLRGRRVNYTPGWDCHGLPIETKTLERLKAPPNSLPPADVRKHAERFAREQIKSQMKEFQSLSIMANWDESTTYRTIDGDYEIRQLRLLQKLVQKNLICRRHRPVLWSPSLVSALAEAEIQYIGDHISHTAYITFRITSPGLSSSRLGEIMEGTGGADIHLLVWTTTPWTIPANMGIGVNSDIQYVVARTEETPEQPSRMLILGADLLADVQAAVGRLCVLATLAGSDLVGAKYTNVFHSPQVLQVVASKHVTATSGTGIVHMAPAHGVEDYATFLANGLLDDASTSVVCPVDDTGRYNSEIVNLARNPDHGRRLAGMSVLGEGTDEILAVLKETGVLVANQRYKHRYPYDLRTNNPMIFRATSQWFASVGDIKEEVFSALESVRFHPESARSRLESFIRERTEWCISRQRVWGSPIPSLHDTQTGEAILSVESLDHIIPILEKKGVSHWWTGPVEEFLPTYLKDSGRSFTKGTDTIDVWFDSGSSWTMLEALYGAPGSSSGVPNQVSAADVYFEGSDQHRGWFQSSLLTAVGATNDERKGKAPFKNLITHGFILHEDGRKMSKSLGNIISPKTIIAGGEDLEKYPAYGVDVLRLWAASVDYTKDISVGHTSLAQVAESLRKLRNTVRFILGNLADGERPSLTVTREHMTLLDRYMMHELYVLETKARESYENFNIHSVVQSLTTFSNSALSALYFDITKDILYADDMNSASRRAVLTVLEKTLDVYTSILAPILPQLAEEIHDSRKRSTVQEASVFQLGWNSVDEGWEDFASADRMGSLLQLRDRVLRLLETARRDGRIRSALESVVEIRLPDELSDDAQSNTLRESVQAHAGQLKALFIVSDVSVSEGAAALGSPLNPQWELSCDYRGLRLYLRPSTMHKCPRCWQHTASQEDMLCVRCHDVVRP